MMVLKIDVTQMLLRESDMNELYLVIVDNRILDVSFQNRVFREN